MILSKQIPNENGYLTCIEQLKDLFSMGCRQRFNGAANEELVKWQEESRKLFKELLGFGTFEPCDNDLFEVEKEDCGEYTRIKYVLQTEEKVYMPFFALIPKIVEAGKKMPSVICPQGHFKRAKETLSGFPWNGSAFVV